MSYLMNDEPEPNYRPFILAFIIMALAIFFALKAHAYTDGGSFSDAPEKAFTPVGSQYTATKEPQVAVDRHVLDASDYRNDATILIAGRRVAPKFEVSEPKPAPIELIREVLPPSDKEVTITATIESDTEAPTNYPL